MYEFNIALKNQDAEILKHFLIDLNFKFSISEKIYPYRYIRIDDLTEAEWFKINDFTIKNFNFDNADIKRHPFIYFDDLDY